MSGENDYANLPLEERLVHKLWKARLEAYDELSVVFSNARDSLDSVFQDYENGDLFKKILLDSNVVAQESGYKCFVSYLTNGATPSSIARFRSINLVMSICEKGLSSSRKATKDLAIESLLIFVEICNSGDIVEDIIPYLTNRLPKLVSGCITTLSELVKNFGCKIISPKPIIPYLPKLFAHADKNVRSEVSNLTIELYIWMGENLKTILFEDLKPIQQKDLLKSFDSINSKPQQLRLTRKQKEEHERERAKLIAESQTQPVSTEVDSDVLMEEVDDFNPLDLVEPEDVISKFPKDLNERISSTKWKDRVEILEEIMKILEKSVKISPNDEYNLFFRTLAKCMKDANVQVVQLASDCVSHLVKGLGNHFQYKATILLPIIERTKEKKQSVADALSNALDSIFTVVGISAILEDTLTGMKNKTPQIKISSTNYLRRCLSNSKTVPTLGEIELIMSSAVKLLSESQEVIRQASTELIGTLMKITDVNLINGFLDKVDDNRKAKVLKYSETAESKVIKQNKAIPQLRAEAVKKLSPPSLSSLPSKRTATSPAKRSEAPKQSSYGVGLSNRLVGRLITTPASNTISSSQHDKINELTIELNQSKALIEALKLEKAKWSSQKEIYDESIETGRQDFSKLSNMLNKANFKVEELIRENNNALMLIKQKDTQISRLNNDLEGERLKTKDLSQQIEMNKLKHNKKVLSTIGPIIPTASSTNNIYHNVFNSEELSIKSSPQRNRITSGELSSRVNLLSIDSNTVPLQELILNTRLPDNNSLSKNHNLEVGQEESWRKATEITSKLKARIEQMKSRSRGSHDI